MVRAAPHKSDDRTARPADCSVVAFGAKPVSNYQTVLSVVHCGNFHERDEQDDDERDDSQAFDDALTACRGGRVTVPFGAYRLDRSKSTHQNIDTTAILPRSPPINAPAYQRRSKEQCR